MKPNTFEEGIVFILKKYELEDRFTENPLLVANFLNYSETGIKRSVKKIKESLISLKDAYFNYALPFGWEWPFIEKQWAEVLLNSIPPIFILNPSLVRGSKNIGFMIKNLFMSQISLMVKKQHDYGHQNIMEFGQKGLIVRCFDKINRIENLIKRFGNNPEGLNEPFLDSWMDIWNYALIGLMVKENVFTLPLSMDLKGK